MTGKLLWHGGDLGGKTAWGGNTPWMLYHSSKFYHRDGAIIDALTGKILAGAIDRRIGLLQGPVIYYYGPTVMYMAWITKL